MLENVYEGLNVKNVHEGLNVKNVYEGLNARSEVYLSKEYFCKMFPNEHIPSEFFLQILKKIQMSPSRRLRSITLKALRFLKSKR